MEPEKHFIIIIGAGPAGLASSACLRKEGDYEHIVIEKSDCIAPLWQYRTYDQLTLQRPKKYCQLPYKRFPATWPKYLPKEHFIKYLNDYAEEYEIKPQFNEEVTLAKFRTDRWLVTTTKDGSTKTYECKGLVVATGRDEERKIPNFEGLQNFPGEKVIHSADYKNGEKYRGKKVLVVGSGDSGIDICGDLKNHGAKPIIVIHKPLIQDFSDEVNLCDISTWAENFGDCENGLIDPQRKIKIRAYLGIVRFCSNGVVLGKQQEYVDIDYVVMATGFDSNVPKWLKEVNPCFDDKGVRKQRVNIKEMVKARICVVGFTKRGLLGIHDDAKRVADFGKE